MVKLSCKLYFFNWEKKMIKPGFEPKTFDLYYQCSTVWATLSIQILHCPFPSCFFTLKKELFWTNFIYVYLYSECQFYYDWKYLGQKICFNDGKVALRIYKTFFSKELFMKKCKNREINDYFFPFVNVTLFYMFVNFSSSMEWVF